MLQLAKRQDQSRSPCVPDQEVTIRCLGLVERHGADDKCELADFLRRRLTQPIGRQRCYLAAVPSRTVDASRCDSFLTL